MRNSYLTRLSFATKTALKNLGVKAWKNSKGANTWVHNAALEALAKSNEHVAKQTGLPVDKIRDAYRQTLAYECMLVGAEHFIRTGTEISDDEKVVPPRKTAKVDFSEIESSFAPPLTKVSVLNRARTLYITETGEEMGPPAKLSYDEFPMFMQYVDTKAASVSQGAANNHLLWERIRDDWDRDRQLSLFGILDKLGLLERDDDSDVA